MDIPDAPAAKAYRFPESSYGATTVTVVLASGRRVDHVVLSGARIVKVGSRLVSEIGELDFNPADVVDVVRSEPRFAVVPEILRVLWRLIRRR